MSSLSARSSSLIRRRMLANGCPAKCALKKLVASVSCDDVYERSVCRMRFCTSPSARDEDQQHAPLGEAQELEMAERRVLPARRHHHAGELREL